MMKGCSFTCRLTVLALLAIVVCGQLPAYAGVTGGDASLVRFTMVLNNADGTLPEGSMFAAIAHNAGDEDVTIQFPSSLQVDYVIDDVYKYSADRAFTTALTEVVIPAGKEYIWEFVHDEEAYPLKPGEHTVYAEIVGTDIHAKNVLYVSPATKTLPKGIGLSVDVDAAVYDPGDRITFTLTATNDTDADIDILTIEYKALQYRVMKRNPESTDPDSSIVYWDSIMIDSMIHDYTDTTVPSGGTLTWNGEVTDRRILFGGEYTLLAGLRNYDELAAVDFTVNDKEVKGTVSGSVLSMREPIFYVDEIGQTGENVADINPEKKENPISGATVTLKQLDGDFTILEDGTVFNRMKKAAEFPVLTVTTGEDGRFSFTDVPLGTPYELTVSKDEYYSHSMVITPSMLETDLYIPLSLDPAQMIKPLPEGIELTLTPEKTTIDPGNEIIFTLTAKNTTDADIELKVNKDYAAKYQIIRQVDGQDSLIVLSNGMYYDWFRNNYEIVTLPAGGEKSWKQNVLEEMLLFGGDYTLSAGFRNFSDLASAAFTITDIEIDGTISGTVTSFNDRVFFDDPTTISVDEDSCIPILGTPLADAVVTLTRTETPAENDVFDTNDGTPVTRKAAEEEPTWQVTTGADGTFSFDEIPMGYTYILTVTKEKYSRFSMNIFPRQRENEFTIPLALERERHPLPVGNSVTSLMGPLSTTLGTGRYVFTQDGYIKGFYRIENVSDTPVELTFDNEEYIEWSVTDPETGDTWSTTETFVDSSVTNGKNTIAPGEVIEFYSQVQIPDIMGAIEIADRMKLEFTALPLFTDSSIQTFAPVDYSLSVPIVIVDSAYEDIDIPSGGTTYNVDCRSTLDTQIDLVFKSADCNGTMNITELPENIHAEFNNHTFIKMVAVDADDTITSGVEKARVRIYFDPESCDNPENLVIAHWEKIGDAIDNNDGKTWKALSTEVNVTEGYAEAYTTGFSSFGLFETEKPTAVEDDTPSTFSLSQNSPNPFNPVTTIGFTIPTTGHVTLTVYNISGQMVERIVDNNMQAGSHSVVFDASRLSSGVYFYKLDAAGHISTKRMLLLK